MVVNASGHPDMLHGIFDAAPVGMMVLDRGLVVGMANRAAREIAGRCDDAGVGLTCGEFLRCRTEATGDVCGDNPSCPECPVRRRVQRAFDTGEEVRDEAAVVTIIRDGEAHNLDMLLSTSVVQSLAGPRVLLSMKRPQASPREDHIKQVLLAIRNVNQLIVAETDPDRLIRRACKALTETLGYLNAWIALLDQATGAVTRTAAAGFGNGFERLRLALEQRRFPPCMNAALAVDSVVVTAEPPKNCPGCPVAFEYSGRTGFAHRLAYGERVYGVLVVSVPGPYAHDREEQELFAEVAGDLGFALRKISDNETLRQSERRFRTVFESVADALFVHDLSGSFLAVNETACRQLGYTRNELLGMSPHEIDAPEFAALVADRIEGLTREGRCLFETVHVTKSGRRIPIELSSCAIVFDGRPAVLSMARDISERKHREAEQEITLHLLQALNSANNRHELIRDAAALMQSWSDCEAIGVRLREGDHFPYYETRGFPKAFVEAERHLCAVDETDELVRDSSGEPVLECMCGKVLRGRFDASLPFFTEFGSFWTNSTTDLLASSAAADLPADMLNRCNGQGYESVALIPLRHGGVTLGLLQFNDPRRRRFDAAHIESLERLAASLSVGLAQLEAAEALREANLRRDEVVRAGNIGLWDWDLTTDKVRYSREWKAQIGYEDEEIGDAYEEWESRVHPDDLPAALERVEAAISDRRSQYLNEFRFRHKDGSYRWIMAQASVLTDDAGRPCRVLGSHIDITEQKRATEALRESEARYRALIETLPYGVEEVDLEGRRVFCNEAYHRMLGYPPDELLGRHIGDAEPTSEEVRRLKDYFEHIKAEQPEPEPYVASNVRKDGEIIDVLVDWTYRRDDAGMLEGFLAVVTDITEPNRAEAALRESERQKNLILTSMAEMVTYLDTNLRVVWANRAAGESVDKTVDELVGMHCHEVWHDRGSPCESCPIVRARDLKAPQSGIVTTPDGRQWFLRGYPVLDEDGEVTALVEFGQDITEQQKTREALVESEQRFRRLYEHLPVGYLCLDEQGYLLEVNSALLDMLGYERDEVIGHWVGDFVARDTVESFRRRFPEYLAAGHAQLEWTVVRKDGSETLLFVVGRAAPDVEGRSMQAHCIAVDVTERRQLEAQLRQAQKMEAVGRLGAGVAHDFNNQLQVILGYCKLLLPGREDDESLTGMIAEMRHAAERAHATTTHLLAFGRKQLLEPELVDLPAFLRDIDKPLGRMLGEDVKLVMAAPPSVSPIYIDSTGLHQAIMNLAVNARDAMPDGGTLVIRAFDVTLDAEQTAMYPEATPGEYVLLEVTDTGVGMDPNTLDQVFEPFFTTKELHKGTGLGLPMVQGFVRQSRGYLRIESRQGEGTIVRILLPPAQPAAPAEDDRPEDRAVDDPHNGATILVVEDEDHVRSLLVRLLEGAGYCVWAANTPSKALELVGSAESGPDLVISDVIMPEMRGEALAERLLSIRKALRFLFISGYMGTEVNGHEIVSKPFDPKELLRRVRMEFETGGASGPARGQ